MIIIKQLIYLAAGHLKMQENSHSRKLAKIFFYPFFSSFFTMILFSVIFHLKNNQEFTIKAYFASLLVIYSSIFPLFLSIFLKRPLSTYLGILFFIIYFIFFTMEFSDSSNGGASLIQIVFLLFGFAITSLGVIIGFLISRNK